MTIRRSLAFVALLLVCGCHISDHAKQGFVLSQDRHAHRLTIINKTEWSCGVSIRQSEQERFELTVSLSPQQEWRCDLLSGIYDLHSAAFRNGKKFAEHRVRNWIAQPGKQSVWPLVPSHY